MPKNREDDPLLKPKAVGELIGRHPAVVVRYIQEGKFPNAVNTAGEGTGRRYGIPRSDVDRFIESRRVVAVSA